MLDVLPGGQGALDADARVNMPNDADALAGSLGGDGIKDFG